MIGFSLHKDSGHIYLHSKGNLQHRHHPHECTANSNCIKPLALKRTTKVLSKACINTIIKLQLDLADIIDKYGGFMRFAVKICLDTMTTTPVESQNNMLKADLTRPAETHHLDKCLSRVVRHKVKRLHRFRRRHRANSDTKKRT